MDAELAALIEHLNGFGVQISQDGIPDSRFSTK
jgi:hypothetical protein